MMVCNVDGCGYAVQPDFWDGCCCFANGKSYFSDLCGGSIVGDGVDSDDSIDVGAGGRGHEVVRIYFLMWW